MQIFKYCKNIFKEMYSLYLFVNAWAFSTFLKFKWTDTLLDLHDAHDEQESIEKEH